MVRSLSDESIINNLELVTFQNAQDQNWVTLVWRLLHVTAVNGTGRDAAKIMKQKWLKLFKWTCPTRGFDKASLDRLGPLRLFDQGQG